MRTTDVLTMLLYGLDMALQPTMRNLTLGEPSWANNVQRRRLESEGLVVAEGEGERRALMLTESGRLRALGGRDLDACWGREWDGRWVLLMFDLKVGNGTLRKRLLRWLNRNRFGCLQKSVWVATGGGDALAELLATQEGEDCSMISMRAEAGGVGGASDAQIVAAAWDFEKINAAYREYNEFAAVGIPRRPTPEGARSWAEEEGFRWRQAVRFDPLLPAALLPPGYLGRRVWATRKKLLRKAAPIRAAFKGAIELL